MIQAHSVWSKLDPKRRLAVLGATVLMFALIIGLSTMTAKPTMALLYSGLEAGSAGEVIEVLEAQTIRYEIHNGAIFVPATVRDELRMKLASDGLPANSNSGYELLDSLSGFGTTSQMFDAAYWRAKEGEIARTIVSSPQIKTARVHIANPSSQPFQRRTELSASVTVVTIMGALSTEQAKAFRYLVASAISGLSPKDVSVIDGQTGVVVAMVDETATPSTNADRAEIMRRNIERLLEARVGVGKAVVEVSVETITDKESIVERLFDPDSRVAISSETEEKSNSSQDAGSGSVTVASNLPDGAGGAAADSRSNNSEIRERINYEISETRREIERIPGAIKRLSVAVLVDGVRTVNPKTGEAIWNARSDDELQALYDLVASAVGLDETRGDRITIKTMEFEAPPLQGSLADSTTPGNFNLDVMSLIQLAVLAVVVLALGVFVIRPIFARPQATPPMLEQERNSLKHVSEDFQLTEIPKPDAEILGSEMIENDFELPTLGFVSDFELGDEDDGHTNDPVKRLKTMIEDRREETAELLRSWLEDSEEPIG